ncbi:D-methionine transport system permease protein [Butyrivibrio hungatei DSM 14810]|jgi:D-methionine transport system permease protein|uniref:D-methionine transport system permease protein n=1 Tax=Butyrivibrio hungatei DSM 14810 TaxID=1121132 RepID=A0A1M7RYT8_9FIRM|nr:methionine ABC transporter permease [Butyrivibrio hungatei]SHN51507.1 D-methionine transport system permease protein [Butyrivibrio hungatei DSM 14810]
MSGILSTTGMSSVIMTAFKQTLYMVFWSTLFSVILGFIPAIILTLTAPDGLKPNKFVYEILSFIINVFRSFPFIILLVILIPFTRMVVGKSIGTTASIVPLTVSAIPFIARVFETSLRETNPGVIEAARSFGASNFQILMRVYVKESIPRMLNGVVLLIISLIGYSAMAGTVGGGGIGDIAIRYGYQQYKTEYLVVCSLVLIAFVQLIQSIGNLMYKKMS